MRLPNEPNPRTGSRRRRLKSPEPPPRRRRPRNPAKQNSETNPIPGAGSGPRGLNVGSRRPGAAAPAISPKEISKRTQCQNRTLRVAPVAEAPPSARDAVYEIQPLDDPRWAAFVAANPRSSVFHSVPWLQALRRTYGYRPVAFSTSPPGAALRDGLVLCRVSSWITGRRLVSLPFSDHCEPLAGNPRDLALLLSRARAWADAAGCGYVELRPLAQPLPQAPLPQTEGWAESSAFAWHRIDLTPGLDRLFGGLHESCIRRKIRRAEREALAYEEGRSESLLRRFYRLQVMTRRRQGLPPQPFAWFRNLAASFGSQLNVRLVSWRGLPIAAILTLAHNRSLVYKYGCSDARSHQLGGMPLLFWRAIQDAVAEGFLEFDLGRSDLDNDTLIRFKERLGAVPGRIAYWRCGSACRPSAAVPGAWSPHRAARRVFSLLPESCLMVAGNLLYKHIG